MVCVMQLVLPVCGLGKILRFFFVGFAQYITLLGFSCFENFPLLQYGPFLILYCKCILCCVFCVLCVSAFWKDTTSCSQWHHGYCIKMFSTVTTCGHNGSFEWNFNLWLMFYVCLSKRLCLINVCCVMRTLGWGHNRLAAFTVSFNLLRKWLKVCFHGCLLQNLTSFDWWGRVLKVFQCVRIVS